MKKPFLALLICLLTSSCLPQKAAEADFDPKYSNYKIHNEFKTYFDECGVEGSIVIFDKNNQQWILSDTLGIKIECLPASTFKIINLLIALETQAIKDENEIIKWIGKTDTVRYGYRPEIYHDMSVAEAFQSSAGWVFIELAKKIGRAAYIKYLTACKYGNLDLSEKNEDFWNMGSFAISPINQVAFIKKLHEEKLPFSKRNMAIVKKVMVTEETESHIIRAKTGWTRENNTNTGWWVGYMEANNNTYYFATLLLQDRKLKRDDFGNCRKEITKKIFSDLGFLKKDSHRLIRDSIHFQSIDHLPIVVNDLEKIKDILKTKLHFTIKEGRAHVGIKNCFVKFQDGTYLEFIEPLDSSYSIGKHYSHLLKIKQGGTSMAIAIPNADSVKKMLTEQNIQFAVDSNKIWQTIEPEKSTLFFIEYADKNWRDNATVTTHQNTAMSLRSTYYLCDDIEEEARKYRQLGFAESANGEYLETPYKSFKIGQSNLYLLDSKKSMKINQLLHPKNSYGICGVEIKANALDTFNNLIMQNDDVVFEANRTTIYFKAYNLFMTFTE